MKKVLFSILGLLLILIAVFFILAFVEPKEITVTRSLVINASKEAVFEQMQYFKNWPHWSPWYEMDTATKITYSGTDGQAGSAYHWVGTRENTGEGDMKNQGVEGSTLNFEVDFTKPYENKATGTLKAEDAAGGTKATWTFYIHYKFPMNAFAAFVNMDQMLGKDFEKGLNNINTYLAAHTGSSSNISETQFNGKLYAGIRATIGWDKMDVFFKDKYAMVAKVAGSKITGPAASLTYKWDTTKKEADMAAVFPVTDSNTKMNGITYFNIPSAKAVAYVLKGGYGGEMKAHESMMQYIQQKGYTHFLVVEEYPAGPSTEPDSNKWITNIYYLVK